MASVTEHYHTSPPPWSGVRSALMLAWAFASGFVLAVAILKPDHRDWSRSSSTATQTEDVTKGVRTMTQTATDETRNTPNPKQFDLYNE